MDCKSCRKWTLAWRPETCLTDAHVMDNQDQHTERQNQAASKSNDAHGDSQQDAQHDPDDKQGYKESCSLSQRIVIEKSKEFVHIRQIIPGKHDLS